MRTLPSTAGDPMNPQNHVSNALVHLRRGVTGAALTVAVCAAIQLLVFGFVHFTTLRWMEPEPFTSEQPLSVVAGQPAPKTVSSLIPVREPPKMTNEPPAALEEPRVAVTPSISPPPDLRSLSPFNTKLRHTTELASSLGVGAALVLALLAMMGVAVAGGASVPGVDRTVSAATWAIIIGVACIPWRTLMPAIPFPGVFSDYGAMTRMSEAVNASLASGATLYSVYFLMPVLAVGASFLVVWRFRAGVAAGVILNSMSELDEAVEREITEISRRGLQGRAPRTLGALNMAIGGPRLSAPEPATDEEPEPRPAPEVPLPRLRPPPRERRVGQPDPGERLRRPI